LGSGSATTTPEGAGIKRVHRRDVGGTREQHVDLDQVTERAAGLVQHALDIGEDVPELRLEVIGQSAILVEAGNAGDVQQVAGTRGKRQRRRLDAGRRREVLDGHGDTVTFVLLSARHLPYVLRHGVANHRLAPKARWLDDQEG
jgi:hypothetical protein